MNINCYAAYESKYKEQSYFVSSGMYKKYYLEYVENDGAHLIDMFTDMIFIMLKPDAIVSGKAPHIVNKLDQCGLKIYDCGLIQNYKERMFEELYKFNLTLQNSQNQISSWWLNRKLYDLGPSIYLILYDEDSKNDIYRKISQMKGSSNPFRTKEGEIRYEFEACNTSVNLIHTSDDPLSSLREWNIFRSSKYISELCKDISVHDIRAQKKDRRDVFNSVYKILPSMKIEIDYAVTAMKIALRMIYRERGCSEKIRNEAGYYEEIENIRGIRNIYKYIAIGERLLQEYKDTLVRGQQCESVPYIVYERLVRSYKYDTEIVREAIDIVRSKGIYLSEWEEVIIISTSHYSRDIMNALREWEKTEVA